MANDMHTDGRDVRSGTYDAISPTGKERLGQPVREKPASNETAEPGADVQSETLPAENPIPEGLLREPKGPLNAQTGRRPAD